MSETLVYTADIVRYFNAEDYSKNGYQNATILNEDVIFPKLNEVTLVDKSIAESDISFYDIKMLDTSAITILDMAKTFKDYKVADSKSNIKKSEVYVDPGTDTNY